MKSLPWRNRMPENVRPCPLCGEKLEGEPFKRKPGFKFTCYGTGTQKHGRVTLYVDMLPDGQPRTVTEIEAPSMADGAKRLLERVKRLSGKGDAK